MYLCPVFETRVILRISSYPWNKKQQRFSNSKSRVTLGITRESYPGIIGGINSIYSPDKKKMAAHFDDKGDDLW